MSDVYTIITPSTELVIPLAEAKLHCRVDQNDEDTFISGISLGVQRYVENHLRKKLLNTTMSRKLTRFPAGRCSIELDYGKVQSVEFIKYYDRDNQLQTLSSPYTLFSIDSDSVPSTLELAVNQDWPYVEIDRTYPVEIQYVVGYGATAEDVPQDIKIAMGLLIGHFYSNREGVQMSPGLTAIEVPFGIDALLAPHRDFRF